MVTPPTPPTKQEILPMDEDHASLCLAIVRSRCECLQPRRAFLDRWACGDQQVPAAWSLTEHWRGPVLLYISALAMLTAFYLLQSGCHVCHVKIRGHPNVLWVKSRARQLHRLFTLVYFKGLSMNSCTLQCRFKRVKKFFLHSTLLEVLFN